LVAVDNSASISSSKYAQVINYVANVVSQLDIDSGKIRVGLLTFSQTAVVQFRLTSYGTRSGVVGAIRRLPYSGYDTNTAAGLRTLRTVLLRSVSSVGFIQDAFTVTYIRCAYWAKDANIGAFAGIRLLTMNE